MENDMPNWAPTTFEQNTIKFEYVGGDIKPLIGETLAEWNLAWLFDYRSMSKMDGTIAGVSAHQKISNVGATAAITTDVAANLYGIKDLAETLGPVEFLDTFTRKPYQHLALFKMCGEDVFKAARTSAEKLARGMQARAEAAQGEVAEVLQTAKIMAFKRPA